MTQVLFLIKRMILICLLSYFVLLLNGCAKTEYEEVWESSLSSCGTNCHEPGGTAADGPDMSTSDNFYTNVVGPFWPPERKLVDDKYQSIPFPFEELVAPLFKMEARWNLDRLVGYLGTWSSVQKFKDKHNTDPIEIVIRDLRRAWGRPEDEREIHWPINMRVGKLA